MIIHYLSTPRGNFGDDLNAFLWRDVIGEDLDLAPDVVLVGIGTLLDTGVYAAHPDAGRFVCLGTGTGYGDPLQDMRHAKWEYRVLRGPLSAKRLGLDRSEACTDGAMLLALKPDYRATDWESRSGVLFMPHHQSLIWPLWEDACADAGIEFVSPREEPAQIIDKLKRARLVLAEAMHGAICADVYRTPWLPVTSSPMISGFKWQDWAASLDVPYEPAVVSTNTFVRQMLLQAKRVRAALKRRARPAGEPPVSAFELRVHANAPRTTSAEAIVTALFRAELRLGVARRIYDELVGRLAALRGQAGMLSNDRTFEARRSQMYSHVERVRAIAQSQT